MREEVADAEAFLEAADPGDCGGRLPRRICAGMELADLPGGELVERGLADLARGVCSSEALLVAIGAPRLRALGVGVPPCDIASPEHRLYELLARDDPDAAHGRYNALVRRLVSFERALACAGR